MPNRYDTNYFDDPDVFEDEERQEFSRKRSVDKNVLSDLLVNIEEILKEYPRDMSICLFDSPNFNSERLKRWMAGYLSDFYKA